MAAPTAKIVEGSDTVKEGLAQMLKGGVIMDVMNPEQAKIAEAAGACAVMALERIPADIRRHKGVARMSDPKMIKEIVNAVSIPVMAKCRIGHFVEAQILQQIGVDCVDESEVLTIADEGLARSRSCTHSRTFLRGRTQASRDATRQPHQQNGLQGALRMRVPQPWRGIEASCRGREYDPYEAGTGDIVEAVRHVRTLHKEIRQVQVMDDNELFTYAKEVGAPLDLVQQVKRDGRLPVVNFAAGGVATPADAALCMQLGVDGVFVGSGIFKSSEPEKRARAIVKAMTLQRHEDARGGFRGHRRGHDRHQHGRFGHALGRPRGRKHGARGEADEG